MKKNIIITGMPRSGKSTLLKKLITPIDQKVGFITNEVRKEGERVGFEVETHNGKKSMLAHVDFKTDIKVSKYVVDIKNLDDIIPSVEKFNESDLLFLDEIGQMELYSEKFKILVKTYLDSPNICIATVSKIYSDEYIETIKKRNDIILIEIHEKNRDEKEKYIDMLLQKIGKAKKYVSEPHRFTMHDRHVSITTEHGTRLLTKKEKCWICDCDFFLEYTVCSHSIALEEYLK